MQVTKVYKRGNRKINEDAYVWNEQAGIFATIDGATGLDGAPGHVASGTVQKVLDEAMGVRSLFSMLKAANRLVGEAAVHHLGMAGVTAIDKIPKQKRSTCGVAAVSLDENRLFFDYIHAADCMIFLQYTNGDIWPVTFDILHYFDQKAIDQIVKLRRESDNRVDMDEARAHVKPTLLENRAKLNTAEGYGVIDGSEDALDHLEYGRLSLKKVTGILLLSDGLLLPTEIDESNAWEQTATIAFNDGLDGLVGKVETRENSDPQCEKYPRLKMKDDKTGLLIKFDS